jgi:adenylate kinase family enzyme
VRSLSLLSQAYILGGSPCSGKSTIAERLAAQYGLHYYKVDDHEEDHAKRCDPVRHPVMVAYSKMRWNDIWSRPVEFQVREEFTYYRERFEMIVQDLDTYDTGKPLILEGAAYFPDLIKSYGVDPQRVLYMVPTHAFQVRHYQQRPWIHHILRECDDPEQAFENWMMRDHLFGQEILRQAEVNHYRTLVVDGKQSIDELFEIVRDYLGLARK